jgi:hypothetical protein
MKATSDRFKLRDRQVFNGRIMRPAKCGKPLLLHDLQQNPATLNIDGRGQGVSLHQDDPNFCLAILLYVQNRKPIYTLADRRYASAKAIALSPVYPDSSDSLNAQGGGSPCRQPDRIPHEA